MKKVIASLLTLVFLLAPTMVVAQAVDYAALTAQLGAIKLSDIPKYDTPLPTGGTKKTEKEFYALFEKYPYKETTKGTTNFSYTLVFSKSINYQDPDQSFELVKVAKEKSWYRDEDKNNFFAGYTETYCLLSAYDANEVGKTKCYLSNEDKTYYYGYSWIKGQKTGELWKTKKEPGTADGTEPTRPVSEYIFYKDETLLGQLCSVYSIKQTVAGEGGYSYTNYYWRSTVNGKIIKTVYASEDNRWLDTRIYFVDYRLNKPADFYTPPKDVKFTEPTN